MRIQKLGRKIKTPDPRDLKLADYRAASVRFSNPPSIDYSREVPTFGMYGNDRLGDCGIAAIGNLTRLWTAAQCNERIPTDEEVISVYHILSPQDDGVVLRDVLKYWTKNPICGSYLAAFVSVNVADDDELKFALATLGCLYVGVSLPASVESQGTSWDFEPGDRTLGGHCVPLLGYGDYGWKCETWSEVATWTPAWKQAYLEEAWALLNPLWLNRNGVSPEGIDLDSLKRDLKMVSQV